MPISTREVKIELSRGEGWAFAANLGMRGGVGLPRAGMVRRHRRVGGCPGRGSCAPAGLVAPAELDLGAGILDGELNVTERLAEGLRGVAQEASTLGAGHADPLIAPLQVDLA